MIDYYSDKDCIIYCKKANVWHLQYKKLACRAIIVFFYWQDRSSQLSLEYENGKFMIWGYTIVGELGYSMWKRRLLFELLWLI